MLVGRNLPQLFQADAVFLGRLAVLKLVPGDDGLGQGAAHALGDEDIFAVQFNAGLEIAGRLALAVDAEDAGDDALHLTRLFFPDDVAGGHAGIDLDAQRLGLFAQPARDVAQRGDVAAVIVHEGRHQRHRQRRRPLRAQQQELVLGDRRLQRGAAFLPVGEQFVQRLGIDDRARQDMTADLSRLFQNGDGDFLAVLFRALLQADGRRQAGRAAADDHDIVFHDLALDAVQRLQRRQIVDDGVLTGVLRAAFDGVFGHGFP